VRVSAHNSGTGRAISSKFSRQLQGIQKVVLGTHKTAQLEK